MPCNLSPTDINWEERFLKVYSLLSSTQKIWSQEVLIHYPDSLNNPPPEWLDEIANLDEEALFQFDGQRDYSQIKNSSLKSFFAQVLDAEILPSFDLQSEKELDRSNFLTIRPKKIHEIEVIRTLIEKLQKENHIPSSIVDIGGGRGHLARILAGHYNIPVTIIEQNPDLIEAGIKIFDKYAEKEAPPLKYINSKVGDDFEKELPIFQKSSFSLGLHTCGPLANAHLKLATGANKGLINVGCCYNKLNPLTDLNLSSLGKKCGLTITNHALSLSTRRHGNLNREEYEQKRRVKSYRYTLHLFLCEKGLPFQGLGNSKLSLYKESFSTYALDNFKKNNIEIETTAEELDSFFFKPEIKNLAHRLFCATQLRFQWGRIIELYILIDRLLFLKERGYQVSLTTLFNERLSPRNIALIGLPLYRESLDEKEVHQD